MMPHCYPAKMRQGLRAAVEAMRSTASLSPRRSVYRPLARGRPAAGTEDSDDEADSMAERRENSSAVPPVCTVLHQTVTHPVAT